jgi:transcriptional regulator of heat shock response
MNIRQAKLLCAIIDQFIQTAVPVGSKNLLQAAGFDVCGATIRNEMRFLCEEGYLEQPHVSAGRIPTAKGYRVYVGEYMAPTTQEKKVRQRFESLKDRYFKRKDQERVYEAVALLSHMMPNVAFATVPHKDQVYYLGLANALRQPEFQMNPLLATGVCEVLESRLHDLVGNVTVDDKVRSYIGEDHLLPQIQSCAMMITRYGEQGVVGILGPMRMDYPYNHVALDMAAGLLRSYFRG